jgi:hypothetical protein
MVKNILDYILLIQFVGFLIFYFLSNNPYKSILLYFSLILFISYWIVKLFFINIRLK